VTLAARSPLAPWAAGHGLIDRAVDLESLSLHPFYSAAAEAVCGPQTLRFLRDFDRVISFLGGPEETVSRRLRAAVGDRVVVVDPKPDAVTEATGRHITQQWAAALTAQDVAVDATAQAYIPRPAGGPAPPRRQHAPEALTSTERAIICHPGSGSAHKCCTLDAWEAVVGLLREAGHSVWWMTGPAEADRLGAAALERLAATAPLVRLESVVEAAEAVRLADCFIGHDAGMTHVAGITGVLTIAVFGPTDPAVWRPLGRACRIVGFPRAPEPLLTWARGIARLAPVSSPRLPSGPSSPLGERAG